MREILKRIFWKLPIDANLKEKLREARYERILNKELEADEKGNLRFSVEGSQAERYAQQILASYKSRADSYVEYEEKDLDSKSVCLAAYYLTQFHPNPENDAWWGKGTTEWNNVNQAVPQFVGHYQPRRPGELGYYDLRLKEVMARQIEIAKNYGIGAFCFYYYWFDKGKRLLERPLNQFLADTTLAMPFFYCWANENWTKRFSGTNNDVLIGIMPTEDNYKCFIDVVMQDFTDERYYRINGRPALSVYRPTHIPEPNKVIEYWKYRVRSQIGVEPYLIAVQERDTSIDWREVGFDAETEFQPKQIQHACKEITKSVKPVRKDFGGNVYDYKDLVENRRYVIPNNQKKPVYPAVMPMWDNTARRNHRGVIFHGSTPDLYQQWLSDVISNTVNRSDLEDKLVFINAWNEWGEGAYLEPDQYYGYAYLDATLRATRDK